MAIFYITLFQLHGIQIFTNYIFFFLTLGLFIYLFIYGCVGSSFLVRGLSLVVASGGHSSSRCAGLSLSWPLLLQSTGSRRAGSAIVAHGPSCSVACGIFPDQGSNPCPLHWQADSEQLRHQRSPSSNLLMFDYVGFFCFVFCFLSKNSNISWLLPYLLRAIPQSY